MTVTQEQCDTVKEWALQCLFEYRSIANETTANSNWWDLNEKSLVSLKNRLQHVHFGFVKNWDDSVMNHFQLSRPNPSARFGDFLTACEYSSWRCKVASDHIFEHITGGISRELSSIDVTIADIEAEWANAVNAIVPVHDTHEQSRMELIEAGGLAATVDPSKGTEKPTIDESEWTDWTQTKIAKLWFRDDIGSVRGWTSFANRCRKDGTLRNHPSGKAKTIKIHRSVFASRGLNFPSKTD